MAQVVDLAMVRKVLEVPAVLVLEIRMSILWILVFWLIGDRKLRG